MCVANSVNDATFEMQHTALLELRELTTLVLRRACDKALRHRPCRPVQPGLEVAESTDLKVVVESREKLEKAFVADHLGLAIVNLVDVPGVEDPVFDESAGDALSGLV